MRQLILLMGAVLGLTSCTTKLALMYDPVIKQQEQNHTVLAVDSFEDGRKNPSLVGVKRNGLGMPIIKIKTDDDVSKWVTDALQLELARAGYTLSTDEHRFSDYQIQGRVLQAFTSTYLLYHGNLQIKVSVYKEGKEVFAKTYHTRKSGGLNFFATDKACAKTLQKNLQQVCSLFIRDFQAMEQKMTIQL